MNLKKMIQIIGDKSMSRQERTFRLLSVTGLIGLAAGIISGFVSGENMYNNIVMIAVFAVLLAFVYFSLHFRKIQFGAVLIAAFIIYLVLPVNFFTTGGIYGGGPIWFLFGVVFVCLVVEKKIKYFLGVSDIFVFAVCYLVSYNDPDTLVSHTVQMTYVDSFTTLTIEIGRAHV